MKLSFKIIFLLFIVSACSSEINNEYKKMNSNVTTNSTPPKQANKYSFDEIRALPASQRLPIDFRCKNTGDQAVFDLNFTTPIRASKLQLETLFNKALDKTLPFQVTEFLKSSSDDLVTLYETSARVAERSPKYSNVYLNDKVDLRRYNQFGVFIPARQNGFASLNIQEHTELVLKQFITHSHCYGLTDRQIKFMLTFLAFHDIGKGCADINRNQHKFTLPLMNAFMKDLGYNDEDVKLALALIERDPIGKYVVNRGTQKSNLKNTANAIIASANKSGLKPSEFFKLSYAFYVSDSSAYVGIIKEGLYKKIDTNGCLVFTDNINDNVQKLVNDLKILIDQKSK